MYSFVSEECKFLYVCVYIVSLLLEIKDLVSSESCPSDIEGQKARKLYLIHPVLPFFFNLESIPQTEKVH